MFVRSETDGSMLVRHLMRVGGSGDMCWGRDCAWGRVRVLRRDPLAGVEVGKRPVGSLPINCGKGVSRCRHEERPGYRVQEPSSPYAGHRDRRVTEKDH